MTRRENNGEKVKPGDRIYRLLYDISPNTLKTESPKLECHIEIT